MRKLKFRVWDKNTKRMFYPVAYDWRDNCATMKDGFLLYKSDIQQFTGLKDKNGKEVYEGDIVEIFSKVNGKILTRGEVKFSCGQYSFPGREWNNSLGRVEVIGNIYENPPYANASLKEAAVIPTQEEVREALETLKEEGFGKYNYDNITQAQKILLSLAEAYEKCEGWPEVELPTEVKDSDADYAQGQVDMRDRCKLALLKKVESLQIKLRTMNYKDYEIEAITKHLLEGGKE